MKYLLLLFLALPLHAQDSTATIDRGALVRQWQRQAAEIDGKLYRSMTDEQRALIDAQKQLNTQIQLFNQLADSTLRVRK